MNDHPANRETVLGPSRDWSWPDLSEFWSQRHLALLLAWRDIKVRYRQTFFGAAWAVVPPFVTMVIFSVVFGRLVNVPSNGLPYWAFSICGLVPWNYFTQAVGGAANSPLSNSSLIEKVYFSRLALPFSAVLTPLVDLLIALVVLLIACALSGIYPTSRLVALLPLLAVAGVAALGMGSLLAGVNVLYRDVRHVIPLLLQVWLFATPIVYPSSLLPEPYRVLAGLNPMSGVVEGFRWALLGTPDPPWTMVAVSAASAVMMLGIGLMVFTRLERVFADRI